MRSKLACRFAPLLSLLLAAHAQADVIGLDALHLSGTEPATVLANGANLDSFRATLVAEGHQLVSLSSFDAASLEGLDAVFLLGPYLSQNLYTASEQQALNQFVLSGGGVVYLADSGPGSDQLVFNTNEFLAPFGIRFDASPLGSIGAVLSQLAKDPLLDGVSSIGLDYYRPASSLSWPASDLTQLGAGRDTLVSARLSPQSGLLVALGDVSLWLDTDAFADFNIGSLDNRRLLQNITRAVLEPNPCSAVSRLYGSATAATPGAPLPRLFSDCPPEGFGLRVCVDSGPALARGLLLIGLAEASIPLDGITQLVAPILAIPHQLDATGTWTQGVPVPSAPLLAGMPLYFQVGYGTSASKLAASQALEWRP